MMGSFFGLRKMKHQISYSQPFLMLPGKGVLCVYININVKLIIMKGMLKVSLVTINTINHIQAKCKMVLNVRETEKRKRRNK